MHLAPYLGKLSWYTISIVFSLPFTLPSFFSNTHTHTHTSICASSLCLCSQDTAADNEIIVLDEMSGVQSEGRGWPVEVLLVTTQSGDIIVLNRYAIPDL